MRAFGAKTVAWVKSHPIIVGLSFFGIIAVVLVALTISTVPHSAPMKHITTTQSFGSHGGAVYPTRRTVKPDVPVIPYSQFIKEARAGDIKSVKLDTSSSTMGITTSAKKKQQTVYPPGQEGQITNQMEKLGIETSLKSPSHSSSFSIWNILLLVFAAIAVLVFLARRQGAKMEEANNNKQATPGQMNKVADGSIPTVRFADIAGCDEAVEEVQEMVDFLRHPARFHRLGAIMPSGVILHGDPGTGKTMLAKALAAEAGLPFYAVSGSEFVEKYVGVGASRIRELFAKARQEPGGAVVFIDEIDAIGGVRSTDGNANSEREQTLNQLLTELDGFHGRNKLICLAATNRLDMLDPALLRPGRFSRHIQVDPPNEEGRLQILHIYAQSKLLGNDVDLARLARITAGSSGAMLADMMNESAIMAAREEAPFINQKHLEEGHLRVLAGPEKRQSHMREDERAIVAYHEAGHALVAELCETQDKVQRVTIRPRGKAAGLAITGATDRSLYSMQFIHERLMHILGGRAAEHVVFHTVSSGAANDLQQANSIARQAVEELGMSPRVGQITKHANAHSADLQNIVDQEVERMVAEAYGHAIELLEEHRPSLQLLAECLENSEDIDRLEILAALGETDSVNNQRQHSMGPLTAPVLQPMPDPIPAVMPTADPAPVPNLQAKGSKRLRAAGRWIRGRQTKKKQPDVAQEEATA